MRLLHAGGLEVLQDHLGKGLLLGVVGGGFRDAGIDQLVVVIHAEHAVGAEALDGEGTGHADLLLVVVGLVVEVFKLGLGGDGLVDLLLPGDAGLPPVGVQILRRVRPLASASRGISHSCQCLLERGVQLLAQRLQLRLPLVPDDIDLRVVGDGLEGDVRHALIDEAVADVPLHGLRTRRGAGDFGFLELALAGIGQQVKGITRAHDAGTGQRQRHARGVNRDPAAAPLLGDGGGGAGTAGRVEHEIAGVGGHEEAAFNDSWRSSERHKLYLATELSWISPNVLDRKSRKVVNESDVVKSCSRSVQRGLP